MAELPWGSLAEELTKPVTPTQPPASLWKRTPGHLWVTVVTQLPRQPACTSTPRQQRAGKSERACVRARKNLHLKQRKRAVMELNHV